MELGFLICKQMGADFVLKSYCVHSNKKTSKPLESFFNRAQLFPRHRRTLPSISIMRLGTYSAFTIWRYCITLFFNPSTRRTRSEILKKPYKFQAVISCLNHCFDLSTAEHGPPGSSQERVSEIKTFMCVGACNSNH